MIRDGRHERAVQVTIDAPAGVSVLNLQELAEKAWRIEEIAQKARSMMFDEKYQKLARKPQGPHSFYFYTGGYSAGSSTPTHQDYASP